MAYPLAELPVHSESPIHTLDPRVKLLLTLAVIVSATLLPPGAWLAFAALTALLWTAILIAGVGLRAILRRTLPALPFVLAAITIVFTAPGNALLRLSLGPLTLTISDAGLIRFLAIGWKAWLSVQAALLLTTTTQFLEVLWALRALRLPAVLVAILSLMYRYLFVLTDEAHRLLRARECRAASLDGRGGRTVWWRARIAGQMVGTLMLRAFERSERIYIAMVARGYQGELRSLAPSRLTRRDWHWAGAGGLLLLLIVAQAYLA